MASFDTVNYSLRPSKSIQRQIVFDGIRQLQFHLDLDTMVYIGFGSIWFTDFIMAHKVLHINDMISIEASEIGFRRAKFNCPFATVRVKLGHSNDVIPTLYGDEIVKSRPWFTWLDYDYEYNDTVKIDVRSFVENAPANSIIIVTFNGSETRYGKANERPTTLRDKFGAIVPDDLSKQACMNQQMQETLADFALDFMRAVAADLARPGGFLPAVRVVYKDTTPMVTVGGILPAKGAVRVAIDVVNGDTWPCRPKKPILAPQLTMREASTLQSQLPITGRLSRAAVQTLGFDLEDEQIETFQSYYKQYPSFAQIVA